MVEALAEMGVEDLAILHAFDIVPRHHFVPPALRRRAYEDAALPLGFGQTISRPSVHALHLLLGELEGTERVLEVGTGSGFQTALLSVLTKEVYSVERIPELAERAKSKLAELGLPAHIGVGDGSLGWPGAAPFDVILVGAAAPRVPEPLTAQLAEGGRLLIPVGSDEQALIRVRRTPEGFDREEVEAARFVPLVGRVDG